MADTILKGISALKAIKVPFYLKDAVKKAPDTPIPKDYPVNLLAKALHPDRQYLKVTKVTERGPGTKSFELSADPSRGTPEAAWFNAGDYLSVFLDVDGAKLTRPYSISSAPRQTLDGSYELTIKSVPNGVGSNYILNNWVVGTEVVTSGPLGTFEYEPFRDARTVIGIAGGSGITPFYSFAQAIADGDEDFNLILLYGSRTEADILFKDELDALAAKTPKFQVVNVLSDEEREGYEHGFVNAELIQKYAPDEPYSVFLCGPEAMYRFAAKELKSLGLEKKYVRFEAYEHHDPSGEAEYPDGVPETVNLTVTINGKTQTVVGSTRDSVLQIMEKCGIAAPARCRAGECGWCHSRLISGDVYVPQGTEFRREADKKFGYIHPCCSFPLTDLEIEVPYAK